MADTRAEHIAQLAELIKDVEVAMFTTTGVDGRLYSRPLATSRSPSTVTCGSSSPPTARRWPRSRSIRR
jgi:general stress protein 26